MRDDSDHPGPLALSIFAASRVTDLKTAANELATLKRAAERPIPILPVDPVEREMVLTFMLLLERDRFHRALSLVEHLIG